MQNPFILLHISDLHFGKNTLRKRDFLSKRATGYINQKLRRKKTFNGSIRNQVLTYVQNNKHDFLCISGDVTNLAYEREFIEAKEKLNPVIDFKKTFLIPGNHDRYVKSATKADFMQTYFSYICPFTWEKRKQLGFVIRKLTNKILLIGIDMSVPRTYMSARGKINKKTLNSCRETLKNREYDGCVKIVVGHYPVWVPDQVHDGYLHQLSGKKIMREFLLENEIDLYLHGHVHRSWVIKPYKDSKLICINSGGCCKEDSVVTGFHKIQIKEDNKIQIKKMIPQDTEIMKSLKKSS